MGLHGGYENRNSCERNKNEIVLTRKLSLSGASIDQNALRFSQMQYGLLRANLFISSGRLKRAPEEGVLYYVLGVRRGRTLLCSGRQKRAYFIMFWASKEGVLYYLFPRLTFR